jgi:hypothetical protein
VEDDRTLRRRAELARQEAEQELSRWEAEARRLSAKNERLHGLLCTLLAHPALDEADKQQIEDALGYDGLDDPTGDAMAEDFDLDPEGQA